MPRIRKKTSRRGTTNQREKIKHKVSETRKKRKKETRKNPNKQWKSKNKDPGIPNNFPYKDQILAEVAEQRRQAEEAKQRRKELKKAAKAAGESGDAEQDDEEVVFDGVSAVKAQAAGSSKSAKAEAAVPAEDAEMDETPALLSHEFPDMKSVLEAADVVVEVLDARDPLAYRSAHLEEFVKEKDGKKLLLVLNKIDACPREAVSAWAASLRQQHPTVLFRSASAFLPSLEHTAGKGKSKVRSDDALGSSTVISVLQKWAEEKTGDEPLVAAVVGLTNSGKSSFINSLARKPTLPTYKLSSAQDGPSTTILPQEVSIEVAGKKIRLVDTPGLVFTPSSDASPADAARTRSRDILVRNKGRIDRLKDPEPVVDDIVNRTSSQDLMLFYNLPAFADKNSNAFLSALARANNLIKKGGVLDTIGACRILLRDWSTGKFPRYSIPAASDVPTGDLPFAELYANDDKVLTALPTRKERRKTDGLVKLSALATETRRLVLEEPWVRVEESSDEEDEEEAAGDDTDEVSGDDDEEGGSEAIGSEDEEEEEEEEIEQPIPPAGKRKRAAASKTDTAPPPKKKVAFAAEPKNTKQAHAAAGARGPVKKDGKVAPAAKPKAATAKPVPVKKVANAAPAKQSTNGGEEAYDFKKFF